MRNISFDNPYLLLLLIPILAIISIPYFIAVRRDNRSPGTVASFVIHIVICFLVVFAAAGTVITTVMTETNVYIVADVSYSSNENLDKIDAYIAQIKESLPQNSKLGIVCFGKDHKLLTDMGGEIVSVKTADVDSSATNISEALNYTATLFKKDVIKRIVLISDGKETGKDSINDFIGSVEALYANHIYIDAVYLDNNIAEDSGEIQISGVDFTQSTYLNHETDVDALVRAGKDTKAIITLYRDSEKISQKALDLTKGYNVVSFELDTATAGSFDYEVVIESDSDVSKHNNSYRFTQSVSGNIKVLLITSNDSDVERANALYGDKAEIDAFVNTPNVPYTVEELCIYDEIIISDTDVREINNFTSFVDAVDTVVSLFGKSLVSFGDLQIQNKTDSILKTLEDMLPVKFGNNDQEPKLYGLVLDSSRSMQNMSRLKMMKQAALSLLSMLSDEDYVTIVSFSGDVTVLQSPIKVVNRKEIIEKIEGIQPSQGTYLGKGLEEAYKLMALQPYNEKQVMLISDGMSYALEPDNPVKVAESMRAASIIVSAINPASNEGESTLKSIAAAGGGNYYRVEDPDSMGDVLFAEIADDITESVIEKQTPVKIDKSLDESVKDITFLPDVMGYVYARAKESAQTVLLVEYEKNNGAKLDAPLYSYWTYGNGRVTTFTSSLSGEWTANWQNNNGEIFLSNIVKVNTPKEKIDYPYTLTVNYDGTYSYVEVIPTVIKPRAKLTLELTFPDGKSETKELMFDSEKYSYEFRTPSLGKYSLKALYSYDDKEFTSESAFNISYSPEYDSFTVFDASDLNEAIRNRGSVSEGALPKLENDESEVAKYTVSFAIPFFIAAVVLFVIDVIFRKLKWNDIKSLFKKSV